MKKTFEENELALAITKAKNFEDFFQTNKEMLITYAENQTGERFNGLEPLLDIDTVRDIAQEFWEDYTR